MEGIQHPHVDILSVMRRRVNGILNHVLFNRKFQNYSLHYLRIIKKTPRKKRPSPLKIGTKKLEDHTKTLLSKICPPRKGQRLRRTLLPYLTDLSKNCESPRTCTRTACFGTPTRRLIRTRTLLCLNWPWGSFSQGNGGFSERH